MYSLFLKSSLKGIERLSFDNSDCKLKDGVGFSTSIGTSGLFSFEFCSLFSEFLCTVVTVYASFSFSFSFSWFFLLAEWFWFSLPLFITTSLLINFNFLWTSSMESWYPLRYYYEYVTEIVLSSSWANMLWSSSVRYI